MSVLLHISAYRPTHISAHNYPLVLAKPPRHNNVNCLSEYYIRDGNNVTFIIWNERQTEEKRERKIVTERHILSSLSRLAWMGRSGWETENESGKITVE